MEFLSHQITKNAEFLLYKIHNIKKKKTFRKFLFEAFLIISACYFHPTEP